MGHPTELLPLDPSQFSAFVFDMDGVITDTARVHQAVWKRLFDEFLASDAPPDADTSPFDDRDYQRYVDGKARIDGVESFLASRGVHLDRGDPTDDASGSTAWALANRKNAYFGEALETGGVATFASSVAVVEQLRDAGIPTAVVTASRNRRRVLETAGLSHLFDASVDGVDATELGLAGKPDPALFLEAARRLGVEPARVVVVEDALAGVEAGSRGGFGLVVGVDRVGQAGELLAHGADVVVHDLAELLPQPAPSRRGPS